MHLTRSLYNNLDQEIIYLKKALNGELCDDYYDFITEKWADKLGGVKR